MTQPERLASVSLDLDNLWSYQRTHGDEAWRSFPSYLGDFVPHALDALAELGATITFFVVGRDADAEPAIIRQITAAGHEVGNHSYEHEPWLHLYEPDALRAEITRAEAAIERAAGQRPAGFRGPGYSWTVGLLQLLAERGYLYDASTLPTYIGPLARTYYFWTARLSREERAERRALFGSFREGMRPVRPYLWQLDRRTLLEIPVTTIPGVKTPFHLSYLLYLARYSEPLMLAYLRAALAACRLTGTEPSFLLHPLDLIGGDLAPQLRFFPGMDLSSAHKRRLFLRVLRELGRHSRLVPMSTHARAIAARQTLPILQPATA